MTQHDEALVRELLDTLRFTREGFREQPRGKSVTLLSAAPICPAVPQKTQEALVEWNGSPQALVVSTKGTLLQAQQGVQITLPLVVFRVQWSVGGTSFEVLIDGAGDQFLTVFAEQVRVFAEWDEENAAVVDAGAFRFPLRHNAAAAIAPSTGVQTIAKRSRYITGGTTQSTFQIPFAAQSFLVRSPTPAFWAPTTAQFLTLNAAAAVDQYLAADITAAHNEGRYLPVPSLAQELRVNYGAAPGIAQVGVVEFLIQP